MLPLGRGSSVVQSLATWGSFFPQLVVGTTQQCGQRVMVAVGAARLASPSFGELCPATRVEAVPDRQELCRAFMPHQYYLFLLGPRNLQSSRATQNLF